MRYNSEKVSAASNSRARLCALLCMAAMLAFFVLAAHSHSDSQHDMKCPSCQAGTIQSDCTQSALHLEAPQVAPARRVRVKIVQESQIHAPQRAPRAPPASNC